MLKLSEHRTSLINLKVTIDAIENLNYLIENYSEQKPGPAYCVFDYVAVEKSKVQIDRVIMVIALKQQKQKLVDYMNKLGIDVDY